MYIFGMCLTLLFLNTRPLVLSKLIDNVLLHNQLYSFSKFLLMTTSMSSPVSLLNKTLVSSANKINFSLVDTLTISFVYRLNSIGPRTNPCGTCSLQHVIGNTSDCTWFIETNYRTVAYISRIICVHFEIQKKGCSLYNRNFFKLFLKVIFI